MRMNDCLLWNVVVDVRPRHCVDVELERVERLGGLVFARDVLDGRVPVEEQQPAGFVRKLRPGMLGDRLPDGRRDHHQTVFSIECSTSPPSASQKSAEMYFQPPSARIVTTTP